MTNRSKIANWIGLVCCIINMIYCIVSANIIYLRTIATIYIVGCIVVHIFMIMNEWEL